jgi:ribonuclease HI
LGYVARLQFTGDTNKCTNNITKYEAILFGLRKLRAIGVQTCVLRTDSNVVLEQIKKESIAREPILEKYLGLVRKMESYFKGFTLNTSNATKMPKLMMQQKLQLATPHCPPTCFSKSSKMPQSK